MTALEMTGPEDDARGPRLERLASLGLCTAGIAHEIKNPLNLVNGFAELCAELCGELAAELAPELDRLDPGRARRVHVLLADLAGNAAKIHEHGRRADRIVRSTLDHARGRAEETTIVDLNQLVRAHAELALQARADQPATIRWALDPALGPIRGVPGELGRVIVNLVDNAARARRPDQERAEIAIATIDLGEAVGLRVRDRGVGIPAAIRDRLFTPFSSTRRVGESAGLGLFLSREIIERHGGSLAVGPEEDGYTDFVVTLPR